MSAPYFQKECVIYPPIVPLLAGVVRTQPSPAAMIHGNRQALRFTHCLSDIVIDPPITWIRYPFTATGELGARPPSQAIMSKIRTYNLKSGVVF